MRELDTTYESWSKKRVIFGLLAIIVLVVLGIIVKESVVATVAGISVRKEDTQTSNKSAEEESSASSRSLILKKDIQERLDSIKKEFSSLDATDIASSSPQFKKVMEDIQNLKDLPKNQAKEACYNICRGI